MSNIFTIIYSLIPAISFMAGIFVGFYMHKEDEVMTPRKIYRRRKVEKKKEELEDKEMLNVQELQEYMKAIDEYGE